MNWFGFLIFCFAIIATLFYLDFVVSKDVEALSCVHYVVNKSSIPGLATAQCDKWSNK